MTKFWTLEDSTLIRAQQTADTIATAAGRRGRRSATFTRVVHACPSRRAARTNTHGNAERIEGAYRCSAPARLRAAITRRDSSSAMRTSYGISSAALQLPPEAWLRMSLPHASITQLDIKSDGSVSLRCLGDAGHLPAELVTT